MGRQEEQIGHKQDEKKKRRNKAGKREKENEKHYFLLTKEIVTVMERRKKVRNLTRNRKGTVPQEPSHTKSPLHTHKIASTFRMKQDT